MRYGAVRCGAVHTTQRCEQTGMKIVTMATVGKSSASANIMDSKGSGRNRCRGTRKEFREGERRHIDETEQGLAARLALREQVMVMALK